MDTFFDPRDSTDSGYRPRTSLTSSSTSSSAEEERAARHRRRSGRQVGVAYRGDDDNSLPTSTTASHVSHRRRRSHDESDLDELPNGLLPADQTAGVHPEIAESHARDYAFDMDSEHTPDTEDGRGVVTDQYVVPTWPHGSRLLERRILQAVDRQTEEISGVIVSAHQTESHSIGLSQSTPDASPSPRVTVISGAPPLTLAPPTDTSPLLLRPRMQEAEMPADPRTRLLDLVITNTTASVTLTEMEQEMNWNAQYAATYGPLKEYLQSYQSIFVVSPVDDRVRLRRLFSVRTNAFAREVRRSSQRSTSLGMRQRHGRRTSREAAHRSQSAADRRTGRPSLPSAEALAAHIGSISYSCVAEHLDLNALQTVYHRRGYTTQIAHGVLHVSSANCFDLFLFSNGAVVWWGMDRKNHWMVDDDFLSASNHLIEGVEDRYIQAEIDALFPIWCSYEMDEQCKVVQPTLPLRFLPMEVEPALDRLAKVLCFDHYLVPTVEPARTLVMLTFSHSLGRSAGVDYFEYVTKWSHRHILSIPAVITGLLDYFSTKRYIARLEGEIAVAQLAIQAIHDIPDVLWEEPWLQGYYDMAEQQNTIESRLAWFTSRSDTLLEQLGHIKGRRYRLFMLGSDVFLIVLLILDVIFMTSRLVAKMYFKLDKEASTTANAVTRFAGK
ncbi:hypothetical protein GH5_02780 [Leishmania sp. Ghana 2012 LV757]|uniref:hypothetical protein n=1 Tax=Leishmania sp. Ghana 2012 LV757 TaxID=2803181 RepID=UPI001B4267A1|nr:hypothetical protein GH5_02780 [Leishmania sp. Ghana 2012 LV757]